ncbi:MAG: 4'-phosphopantetheinyl transferase superfamily protein, partial [Dolichospermum sp.]
LEQWLDLLGNQYQTLLQKFKNYDDTLCSFATRLWCVKESVFKATGIFPELMTVEMKSQKGVIFTAQVENNSFQVLTFPVTIYPKNIAVVGIIANLKSLSQNSSQLYSQREKFSFEMLSDPKYSVKLLVSPVEETFGIDPETGKMFITLYTTFKDCRAFWSKTYFTNFFAWIGQSREIGLRPLAEKVARDLESGEYGLVTNDSSITIFNEAETMSKIIGYFWFTDKTDYNRSFLDMEYQWFKQEDDGNLILLANSHLSTTWVKIVDHGVVKQTPMPEYLLNYANIMLLKKHQDDIYVKKDYISIDDIGSLKYQSPPGLRPPVLLNSKVYQTSLCDGNAVGNLYYSNYYDWQAKTLEHFIYQLMPEVFTTRGKRGEYICLHVAVNHLQEAMPFEEIETNMYLEKWYKNGFKLYFEYYSLSGGRRKLAYGNNTLIWALRENESAKPVACELPTIIQDYFQKLL